MRVTELDAYQSPWLAVTDLQGKARRLVIARWAIEDIRERSGETVKKVAIAFQGARKRLLLNATQAKVLDAAFGELENWPGKTVILQPGRTPQGKATIEILILPAAPAPGAPAGKSEGANNGDATDNPFDG